jgi:hypothetical protein
MASTYTIGAALKVASELSQQCRVVCDVAEREVAVVADPASKVATGMAMVEANLPAAPAHLA